MRRRAVDVERERERCDRLMEEMLKTTADLMAARKRRRGLPVNSPPSKRGRGGAAWPARGSSAKWLDRITGQTGQSRHGLRRRRTSRPWVGPSATTERAPFRDQSRQKSLNRFGARAV